MSGTVNPRELQPTEDSTVRVVSFSKLRDMRQQRPREALTDAELEKLQDMYKQTTNVRRYAPTTLRKRVVMEVPMETLLSGAEASVTLGEFMDPMEEFPSVLGMERERVASAFDPDACVITMFKIDKLLYASECDVEVMSNTHARYLQHLRDIGVEEGMKVTVLDKCDNNPGLWLLPNTRAANVEAVSFLAGREHMGVIRNPTIYMHADILDHLACTNPTKENLTEGTVSKLEPTYGGRFIYFTSNHAIAFFFRAFYPVLRSKLDVGMLDGEDVRLLTYKDVVFRGNYAYILSAMDACVKRVSNKIPYENVRNVTLGVRLPKSAKWTAVSGETVDMPGIPKVYMDDSCNIVDPRSTLKLVADVTIEYVMFRKTSDQAMRLMLGRAIDIFAGREDGDDKHSANNIDEESLDQIFMEIEKPPVKKTKREVHTTKSRSETSAETSARARLSTHPWVAFDTSRFY